MTKYLGIAIGVLVLLLAISGFLLKKSYEANGALETKLEAAAKVIEQAQIDKADNARVVGQLTRQLNDTETKVITKIERVYAQPTTNACAQSPAMRAASDGMRELFPNGQADGGRQPAPAVSGPGASAAGADRQ